MIEKENCFCLQEELCAFLKRIAINFPGNDALLKQMTQRMLSVMEPENLEKLTRFLVLFNSRIKQVKPGEIPVIRYDRRLMKAKEYIERNFDKELSLSGIADYVGLAKETLCRMFHKQLSVTYTHFVNDIRIEKSIPLLLTTDDKINDIAYQCGFNSNHYYNRTFRQKKGVSPGMFRKNQ